MAVQGKLKVLYTRAGKNKRCLLIYLYKIYIIIIRKNRMDKLENEYWKYTGNLPQRTLQNFDEKDKKYYEQYTQLLNNYSKKISFSNFDLTKDYSPPTELYCEVRALEDINGIDTYEGKINIEKNHTYSLRRNDIEHYLRKGLFTLTE